MLADPDPVPATELLVDGRTPVESGMLAGRFVVVIDVRVSGQMVVDKAMIEVRIEAEPDNGQLVTEEAQLRTVTSLVE